MVIRAVCVILLLLLTTVPPASARAAPPFDHADATGAANARRGNSPARLLRVSQPSPATDLLSLTMVEPERDDEGEYTSQSRIERSTGSQIYAENNVANLLVKAYTFGDADDIDQDDLPDDWLRRRGAEFPAYVSASIDRSMGDGDRTSLHFAVNGGAAAYYSPQIPISPTNCFILEASVRTRGLKGTAGVVSLSILNARQERLARYLSAPVIHEENWKKLKIGPIVLPAEAVFAVIGCHIVDSEQSDVRGDVWFDNLNLSRLPRIRLAGEARNCYVSDLKPPAIELELSGLERAKRYSLVMTAVDIDDREVASGRAELPAESEAASQITGALTDLTVPGERLASEQKRLRSHLQRWNLTGLENGHYKVRTRLLQEGQDVLQHDVSVVRFTYNEAQPMKQTFGWSLRRPMSEQQLQLFGDLVHPSGVGLVTYPVWRSVETTELLTQTNLFLDRLNTQRVAVVGVISDPPPSLRCQFEQDWRGIVELFAMPPDFWAPSLQPVLARYGSHIHYWQLGDDDDESLIDPQGPTPAFVQAVKSIQTIAKGARVGAAWTPSGPASMSGPAFVITSPSGRISPKARDSDPDYWISLTAADASGNNPHERGARLVHAMINARIQGATTVLFSEPLHEDLGLFLPDGSPGELFLPWRTAALAMQGASYGGQFVLNGGSQNVIFLKPEEGVLILWNKTPTVERVFLGDDARIVDLWGRESKPERDPSTGQQLIPARPYPTIIRHCSASLARWRTSTKFERGSCRSEYGHHEDALTGINPFPQGINGTVQIRMPSDWESEPKEAVLQLRAGEPWRIPVRFMLPPLASLGDHPVELVFTVDGERHYEFRMPLVYRVGLDDLMIQVFDRRSPDGRLEVEQVVTNKTSPEELYDFRCTLFAPGQRRQKTVITRLGNGTDRRFYYLPDADAMAGSDLWLRLEQEGGRRVLNYRWTVGQPEIPK